MVPIGLRLYSNTLGLQRAADLVENRGIVDRRRHGTGLAVSYLLHSAAQDLARSRLRQTCDRYRDFKGRDRPDLLANEADAFLLDLGNRAVHARLKHDEAAGDLALERVGDADHRAFGNVLMVAQHLLHAAG